MKTGLIIGKFMPLHNGHMALINFAKNNCDSLVIVICYTNKETIPGAIREKWLIDVYGDDKRIKIIPVLYDDSTLPNTSVSSKRDSKLWANHLLKQLNVKADIIFSSEKYGNYLAVFLQAKHICFDEKRSTVPVSATQIRNMPATYWGHIPENVRPYFIKKIAIVGSESTGKSVLAEKLAVYFNTVYVPEIARQIIEHTSECTIQHLNQIAALHAKTILEKLPQANKLLFSDTELNITKSYCRFLFNKELIVADWIESANKFNLYLFLEPDCPFIQDGTRLHKASRKKLSDFHKEQLKDSGLNFI